MRGILILLAPADEEKGETSPSFSVMRDVNCADDEPRCETTLEAALARVKGHERANVQFDMDCDDDAEFANDNHRKLTQIETLAWPSQPNALGHYALDSIWGLGLAEDGLEYRFVPIAA